MPSPRDFPLGRLALVRAFFAVAAVLYSLRLVQIQVVRNEYYLRAAEQNRTQTIYQNAPRGNILDRLGRVLATNRPSFSLIYLPAARADENHQLSDLANDLAPHLRQEPGEVAAELRAAIRSEAPTRLAENLDPAEMFRLSELKNRYAGIDLVVEAKRYYPQGALASHLIGYIGAMDPKSWESYKTKGYRQDSWVGRAGVEKKFERQLRGVDGGVQLEVDVHGKLKRVLRRVPWAPGGTVTLTVDLELQKAAEEMLQKSPSKAGAVVVLDPRSGDVLALASLPSYDPNQFLVRKEDQIQANLRNLPEFNLAIQGTFPPGSLFKIVTSAALLNEGAAAPSEDVFCPGHFVFGRRSFSCWKPEGHGRMAFIQALANSCDVYYYKMGLKVGAPLIEAYEKMFRIGMQTHIDLPWEKAGHRFGPESRGRKSWPEGDTLNLAIGQGELLVTPVQMAVMISGVANGGTLYRPQFVSRVVDPYGRVLYERPREVLGSVELKPETWELLREGLGAVVTEGTGKVCNIKGLDVRGKTGTAENPNGEDHAWFMAYGGLPGREPELAVAVLVEHGGHGASAAGPVARRIFETAFKGRLPVKGAPAPAAAPEPPEDHPPAREATL